MKRKWIAWSCLLVLVLGCLGGCGSESEDGQNNSGGVTEQVTPTGGEQGVTEAVTPTPTEEVQKVDLKKYTMTAENVKLLGRTHMRDEILWCGYSASGVEFTVEGTTCVVNIKADNTTSMTGHQARIAILVNGERVVDTLMDEAEKSFTVVSSEEATTAVVRVVKLSEASDSIIGITSVETDGTLTPTEAKARKIEFIGDSITCGYGVDGTLQDTYATDIEDVTKTYAYLAAELLDADYSLVSQSGYGIISGYTGTGNINANQIIPKYYTTALGNSLGKVNGKIQTKYVEWDFQSFVPDTVVINLGTNDNSYCGNDQTRRDEFAAGYVEFLKVVREKNPDAEIVCSLGIMGAELYTTIEAAVATYTTETGDTNIRTFRFDTQNQAVDGISVDWHPSAATHEKAANKLADALK